MTSTADSSCPPREPRSRAAYHVTRPRLHRGHFAYLRAVVQGLSPRAVWERYLPDAGAFDDTPRVQRMTSWIRAELSAAAARGGDFGKARLLRLDLAPLAAGLPSLETFVARRELDNFAEAEQLAAYDEAYGSVSTREIRRLALMRRQLAAIHALEARVTVPVALSDGVESWFTDALAQRLKAAGVPTLYALRARIDERCIWWRNLPGIGTTKARAIEQFVVAHFDAAPGWRGTGLPAHAGAGAAGAMTVEAAALMPMDRLAVPDDLSGQHGRFRAPRAQCLVAADDDRGAIQAWLRARGRRGERHGRGPGGDAVDPMSPLTLTQRAYRKEAGRLLLWAVCERRCALSSMTVEDCLAYRDFLLAPPVGWCGPRAQPHWKSTWRPFAGPLSVRSCAYAIGVLANLFAFLVDQGYLVGNPWRAVVPPGDGPRGPDVGRGLTAFQWHFVLQQLAKLPATVAASRLQFALPFLHDTGLRLAELLAATTADLTWEALPRPGRSPMEGWWLTVRGKGDRIREVPVSPDSLARLRDYLRARGLSEDPGTWPTVALVGANPPAKLGPRDVAWDTARGITGGSFHQQIRRFFARCAWCLRENDPSAATRLERATTHWLRHTHVWHALEAGVPVEIVQQNVGHVSLDTTTRYVKTERVRRLQAMQQLWQADGMCEVQTAAQFLSPAG